ncbi:MAG: patatin-like phospholipase family protein [Solirubrobacterales bacterium]
MPATGDPVDRFRILAIDGGGIRGLIAARVLAELERRMTELAGEDRRIADAFHMLCGTSTGGLLALGLAVPSPDRPDRPRLSGERLADLYVEEGPGIFGDRLQRLRSLWGWIAPKHSPGGLAEALRERFGEVRLRSALRELIVTTYDMSEPGPHFFKRWRARQDADRDASMVDVGLATSAAPTYFPSHPIGGRALVDGGVFAANPVVAAVAEALKRRDEAPADLRPQELLVVSLGTGQYEVGTEQSRVARWGRIGWVWPRRGEPPLISTFLDGQSDAAHHWADVLLNHEPGHAVIAPPEMGRGPRYFRFQVPLPGARSLDDATKASLKQLEEAASRLISDRDAELGELARRLAAGPRLSPDPV